MTEHSSSIPAMVYLVGAGPGDPGLITLRAVEYLQTADVVIYDYLAEPALLKHAADTAKLISLGSPGSGRTFTPDEIVRCMIDEAQQGKIVVRLKGGDPSIFGRGADEVESLRQAGIPYEIVPGITTGLAVAAYCEIPITHHEDASAVALITGRERDVKTESSLNYDSLATFPGTLIFYMGVKRAPHWSRALIEHGKSPDTPVAIVQWCTRANQRSVHCTLETVEQTITEHDLQSPSVFIVGKVVDYAPTVSWFDARPLFARRVWLPGSPAISDKLHHRLSSLGADVITQPVIQITDPPDWSIIDEALDRSDQYDWLVFSSTNGIDYFLGRLFDRGNDLRQLGGVKIAVIGSGSVEKLARYHLQADLVPGEFNTDSLAAAFMNMKSGQRFLLVRASRGRNVLAEKLEKAGNRVDQIVAYSSVDVEESDPAVKDALSRGEIDWITVTSSAAARALVRLYGENLHQSRLASISPLTSAVLRELGFEPAAEAAPHTAEGLVDAILKDRNVAQDH